MVPIGCDGRDVRETGGDIGRSTVVGAPGDHGVVGFQCQTVDAAGCDGRDVRQASGNVRLTGLIVAPGDDCVAQ